MSLKKLLVFWFLVLRSGYSFFSIFVLSLFVLNVMYHCYGQRIHAITTVSPIKCDAEFLSFSSLFCHQAAI